MSQYFQTFLFSVLFVVFVNIPSKAMYEEELTRTISSFWRTHLNQGVPSQTEDEDNTKTTEKKDEPSSESNDLEDSTSALPSSSSKMGDLTTKGTEAIKHGIRAGAQFIKDMAPNDGSLTDIALKATTNVVRGAMGEKTERIARQIYDFWEEKRKSKSQPVTISKELVFKQTACALLDAEIKIKDLQPSADLAKDAYATLVKKWNGASYMAQHIVQPVEINDFFLKGMIRHMFKTKLIDPKECSKAEYKEGVKETVLSMASIYIDIDPEKSDNLIKKHLGSEAIQYVRFEKN